VRSLLARKKILVTGSSGVLGTAVQAVQGEYPDYEFSFCTRKDCDLRDFNSFLSLVKSEKPDAILHLAAVSGGVALSRRYPATILRENILLTLNVLEAGRLLKIRKICMTLSSGMYPPNVPIPFREESIHDGPAHDSNYSYAYAKRLIEPAIRAYRQEYGMNVIGLVPNGIFGENDKFDYEASSMPTGLMRRFYESRMNRSPIVVWGDGSPLRELTYSKDMARAFLWGLIHYDEGAILNVGTAEEHSVKDIAMMIAEELGIDKARITLDGTKPSGVGRKSTDTSKFLQLSHFQATPFRTGLRNTLNWIRENYDVWARSGNAQSHGGDPESRD
jgi:GDP-L-fucose synthase